MSKIIKNGVTLIVKFPISDKSFKIPIAYKDHVLKQISEFKAGNTTINFYPKGSIYANCGYRIKNGEWICRGPMQCQNSKSYSLNHEWNAGTLIDLHTHLDEMADIIKTNYTN